MADITERYRTKYPPKEHEEAVRMLLDGIKQQHQPTKIICSQNNGSSYSTKTLPARTSNSTAYNEIFNNNNNHKTSTLKGSYTNSNNNNNHRTTSSLVKTRITGDYDRRSLTSSSSEILSENNSRSASSGDGDELLLSHRRHDNQIATKMQSKSTSTSDSVSLSSGIDNRAADLLSSSSSGSSNGAADAQNEEAIPSRTIAVQCDLKLSSAKNSEGVFDGSMQVSSISSTRYGFYKLSPETLEARRRLRRSMSSRNVAPTQTTGTLLRRNLTSNQDHAEGPTSMSELSSSAPSLDGGREVGGDNMQKLTHISMRKPMGAMNLHRRDYDEREVEPDNNDDEDGDSRLYRNRSQDDDYNNDDTSVDNREPVRLLQKHGGLRVDRSNSRIASLARRPKTALSYVSTSRLRDEGSPSRGGESSGADDYDDAASSGRGRRNGALRSRYHGDVGGRDSRSPSPSMMRTRAVSHQILPRSRTPAPDLSVDREDNVHSDCESDYGKNEKRRNNINNNSKHRQGSDRFKVPRNEEIQVECFKCQPMSPEVSTTLTRTRSSSRPVKSMSEANEFMRKYSDTEEASTLQRVSYRQLPMGVDLNGEDDERRQPLRQSNIPRNDEVGEVESQQPDVVSTCYTGDEISLSESATIGSRPIQRHQSLACKPGSLRHHHHHHHYNQRRKPIIGGPDKLGHEYCALSRDDRAHSQAFSGLMDSGTHRRSSSTLKPSNLSSSKVMPSQLSDAPSGADVMRSTSMRHMSRLSRNGGMKFNHRQQQQHESQDDQDPVYTTPLVESVNGNTRLDSSRQPQQQQQQRMVDDTAQPQSLTSQGQMYKSKRPLGQIRHPKQHHQHESEDSESPSTRTWANPSVENSSPRMLQSNAGNPIIQQQQKPLRSYSMRDVNQVSDHGETRYQGQRMGRQQQVAAQQQDDAYVYDSSSESSIVDENVRARRQQQFLDSSQLDYDSQHRINEIGLPETHSIDSYNATSHRPSLGRYSHHHQQQQHRHHTNAHHKTQSGAASCLGVPSTNLRRSNDMLSRHVASSGGQHLNSTARPVQIAGRAMSQQSLSRPTMPLTGGRRRTPGSNSGSEVGGSSMSLVSRLHGRYENAHTRSPVVMYIPQAKPGSQATSDCELASSSLANKLASNQLRKSTRSVRSARKMSSSQDRLRKSSSRNGSDSESSSMLRTLVKPRGGISRRSSRMNVVGPGGSHLGDDGEDMDGVGQLASEMDSYKFKRRYSVPKDAKINWFAKLKNRVSSKI